jgi:hypothetical protein
LPCDDCFDLVDSYVEALLSDPNADQPAMRTTWLAVSPAPRKRGPCFGWSPSRTASIPHPHWSDLTGPA